MALQPPAQVFATTLYDREQPQSSLSFVFVPKDSIKAGVALDLHSVSALVAPNAIVREIKPSYLPAALASMLKSTPPHGDPFSWAATGPVPGIVSVDPNSLGFAEYVAFSEVIPIQASPLVSKSLLSAAVSIGAKIGLIAGGLTPLILLTVPAGIILCTAGVIFGAELGQRVAKLIQ
jgi:hypothetical protein